MEEKNLGQYIAIISKYWSTKISQEVSRFNINKTQVEILGVLFYFKGLSQNELGEKLFLDKITVTKNLKGLMREGLVEKKRSEEDRRIKRLYLTAKTEEIGKEIKAIIDKVTATLTRGLSPQEEKKVIELMGKMTENVFLEVCSKDLLASNAKKRLS